MSDFVLDVYRDQYDAYQLVGHLSIGEEGGVGASFAYDGNYLISPDARAISVALPLVDTPYEGRSVRAWFGALIPEGREARELSRDQHNMLSRTESRDGRIADPEQKDR